MKLKPNTQLLCIDDSKQKVLIKGATYTVSENVHHTEISQSNGKVYLNELLSFHYHTGCNFKDIDDLRGQYYTLLEEYDRWSFLP